MNDFRSLPLYRFSNSEDANDVATSDHGKSILGPRMRMSQDYFDALDQGEPIYAIESQATFGIRYIVYETQEGWTLMRDEVKQEVFVIRMDPIEYLHTFLRKVR